MIDVLSRLQTLECRVYHRREDLEQKERKQGTLGGDPVS